MDTVRKTVRLVPTWEAAARIFANNLMHGTDVEVQYQSADELIKMGRQLDKLQDAGTLGKEST
tara:strand:+ start:116 stop:304 length:189 start_codon:yes stop_codon:yes gene_type:complete